MSRLATAVLAALIIGGTAAALAVAEPWPATFSGEAMAVDGDTLRLGAARIRLHGIDAPESHQPCFVHGQAPAAVSSTYDCGAMATAALASMLTRGSRVTCQAKANDPHGRTVATCSNSGGDLGARMVARGWAVDWPKYSGGAYSDHEAAARAWGLGIWGGSFFLPKSRKGNHK